MSTENDLPHQNSIALLKFLKVLYAGAGILRRWATVFISCIFPLRRSAIALEKLLVKALITSFDVSIEHFGNGFIGVYKSNDTSWVNLMFVFKTLAPHFINNPKAFSVVELSNWASVFKILESYSPSFTYLIVSRLYMLKNNAVNAPFLLGLPGITLSI